LFFCDGETWQPVTMTIDPDGAPIAVLKNKLQHPES